MKKRILFMIPNLAHGGAERVLVNLVNNLDKKKYDVTVQTVFDIGVNKKDLGKDVRYIPGFKHQFRANSHIFKLFSPKTLYKRLVKEKYDIIVSYLEGVCARIVSGCTDADTKKVCWIHVELNTPEDAAVAFRSVTEAKAAYESFDRIVAVSRSVKNSFEASLGLNVPIDVLYNTNETEYIKQKSEEQVEDEFYSDCIKLCSVAKLRHTKGFDRLIEAHKRLLDEGYMHKVYIFGIGEKENELRGMIKKYSLQDTFHLMGYKEDPYRYVSKCDLYVCPSREEGFSTAVTEALIVGTPVVSTCCSGAYELLGENDEYGIVTENSAEGVYTGLKKILSQPQLLKKYKAAAEERGKYFSREKTVEAVQNMLEEL